MCFLALARVPTCLTKWSMLNSVGGGRFKNSASLSLTAMWCSAKSTCSLDCHKCAVVLCSRPSRHHSVEYSLVPMSRIVCVYVFFLCRFLVLINKWEKTFFNVYQMSCLWFSCFNLFSCVFSNFEVMHSEISKKNVYSLCSPVALKLMWG